MNLQIFNKHGEPLAKTIRCPTLEHHFKTPYQLLQPRRTAHSYVSRNPGQNIDLSEFAGDENLLDKLRLVQYFHTDGIIETSNKIVYNFHLTSPDETFIEKIFTEVPSSCKINFTFGFTLQDCLTACEYGYLLAATNNQFLIPCFIS